jgi:hypothetical protein
LTEESNKRKSICLNALINKTDYNKSQRFEYAMTQNANTKQWEDLRFKFGNEWNSNQGHQCNLKTKFLFTEFSSDFTFPSTHFNFNSTLNHQFIVFSVSFTLFHTHTRRLFTLSLKDSNVKVERKKIKSIKFPSFSSSYPAV